MALLVPNTTYEMNGVTVKEKIIPDGTRWKSANKAVAAGFDANVLYKKQAKLNGTGKVSFVTIHNTNDLDNVLDDAEQYVRATYNENMNSARVHFYVDDLGAWQELKAGTGLSINDPVGSAEVSWHSGDGSVKDGGNMTSLSMEIIMDDTEAHDLLALDNGARMAAWLLWKNGLGLNCLVTHTYWVNKAVGNVSRDVDVQCTTPVKNKKWCPSYIFGSTNKDKALRNWKEFKSIVSKYLDLLNGKKDVVAKSNSAIEENDLVKISADAVYYTGRAVPDWVRKENWFVDSVKGDRVVIDKNEKKTTSICSPINVKYLTIVKKASSNTTSKPYLIRVLSANLKIYRGPGTNNAVVGTITDKGIYTIVEEKDGHGATKWGKLKSGAGWISLDYTKEI